MAFPIGPTVGMQYVTPGGRTYEYTADGAWKDVTPSGGNARAGHTGTQLASTVSDFTEAAQDAVGGAFDATLVYNDAANTMGRAAVTGHVTLAAGSNAAALGSFTLAQLNTAISDADLPATTHTHLLAAGATDVTMTAANLNTLDDGVDTTLHFHATDRDRANHTGTQLQSTITSLTADLALKADLVAGVVPAAQLPSYVDDILEYANFAAFPVTGLSNKIYLDQASNIIYRWTGTVYAPVSQSLALGTTSSSAHRGDHGVIAHTHALIVTGNPHNTTKTDLGLGNVDNTSDVNKPVSTATTTALNLKADIASPTLTGTPAAPTAAPGTNTTQLATTAFVSAADALKANIASPTLTGTPAAPTAVAGTNTTQIATTAFVNTAVAKYTASATPPASPAVKDLWYDTDDGRLYMRIDDGTAIWMQVA